MSTRLIAPLYQAIDANGNPGNGWKLAFYETGTVNLKDTYSNGALTIANANPVICNCEGRPANGAGDPISILGAFREDYKLILLDADDNVIETKDPVDVVTYDINSFDPRPAQHWGTTTGTADALLIKPDTSISSYSDDLLFTIQISIDNNAGSTLAVFEEGTVSTYLAALDMMKYDNAGAKIALEAGDNQAGQTYLYRIDGTDAVCLNPGIPYVDLTNAENYPAATLILSGIVELATSAEITTATDNTRAITPLGLAGSNQAAVTLLETQTASTSATIEFTGLDGTYKEYRFEGISIIPETDNTKLYMQVSIDNGVSWVAGTSYYFDWDGESQAGAVVSAGDGVAQIEIYDQLGNTSGEFLDFTMTTKDLANAGRQKAFAYNSIYVDLNGATGAGNTNNGQGHYLANTAVNAVKFYMSADAIASGIFKLYGIK